MSAMPGDTDRGGGGRCREEERQEDRAVRWALTAPLGARTKTVEESRAAERAAADGGAVDEDCGGRVCRSASSSGENSDLDSGMTPPAQTITRRFPIQHPQQQRSQ